MEAALFIVSFLTAISALGVVLSKKPLHSALSLVVTLFLVAVQFALLDAHFLAVLQIMVYAGAIMVLVVFVIMLLGIDSETPEALHFGSSFVAMALAGAFLGMLYWMFTNTTLAPGLPSHPELSLPANFGTVEHVGAELFAHYVYPFELASVLLLAAIVGAVLLAHDKKNPLPKGRGLRAKREGE